MQYLNFALRCLVIAAAFLYIEVEKRYKLAVFFKGLASAMYVFFGYLGSTLCSDPAFAKLVLTGLGLGLAADVLLNLRFLSEKHGRKIFMAGILVFLAGHVMYIAALAPLCGNIVIWLLIGAVLTAVILKIIFSRITADKKLKIFGIFYIGAVTIMTTISAGVFFSAPRLFSLCILTGAVLFLASDIVLILNTFGGKTKTSLRILNISLYYIGQLMIGLSLQLFRDLV